jgi:hypothetical protein
MRLSPSRYYLPATAHQSRGTTYMSVLPASRQCALVEHQLPVLRLRVQMPGSKQFVASYIGTRGSNPFYGQTHLLFLNFPSAGKLSRLDSPTIICNADRKYSYTIFPNLLIQIKASNDLNRKLRATYRKDSYKNAANSSARGSARRSGPTRPIQECSARLCCVIWEDFLGRRLPREDRRK